MTRYNYRLGISTLIATGTGVISSSGVVLTGAGTNFDPELVSGTVLFASGQTLAVATMTDDTNATLVKAASPNLSSAAFTYLNMVNIEDFLFGFPPPRSTFNPQATTINLGNGHVRALGRPTAIWQWGFLTRAQRNALRVFFPQKSNACFVHTRKNDNSDAYVTYSAIALWPDEEDRQASRRLNFILTFRDLIAL